MLIGRGAGGWVEAGLVGVAGADGVGHGVVDFEDDALGAVIAVIPFLILSADAKRGADLTAHSETLPPTRE